MAQFIAYSFHDYKVGETYNHSTHGIGEIISVEPHPFMGATLICKVIKEPSKNLISYEEFMKKLRSKK